MIDLNSLGYPNVKQMYLFDFTPGQGGDFFITLASKCSREFILSWENTQQMLDRMAEFEQTTRMPGNNIGGKLIYHDSIAAYKNQILQELKRHRSDTGTKISFCTHPTGDNLNTRISDVLAYCFPKLPLQRVALTISSDISRKFAEYHYGYDADMVQRTQAPGSRFILWEDTVNTIQLDPIDLVISDPEQLKQKVQLISTDVNWEWYNHVVDIYRKIKIDPFLKWYEQENKNGRR